MRRRDLVHDGLGPVPRELVPAAADDVRERLVLERFEPPPCEAAAPRVAAQGVDARHGFKLRGERRVDVVRSLRLGRLAALEALEALLEALRLGRRQVAVHAKLARGHARRQPLAQVQVRGAEGGSGKPPELVRVLAHGLVANHARVERLLRRDGLRLVGVRVARQDQRPVVDGAEVPPPLLGELLLRRHQQLGEARGHDRLLVLAVLRRVLAEEGVVPPRARGGGVVRAAPEVQGLLLLHAFPEGLVGRGLLRGPDRAAGALVAAGPGPDLVPDFVRDGLAPDHRPQVLFVRRVREAVQTVVARQALGVRHAHRVHGRLRLQVVREPLGLGLIVKVRQVHRLRLHGALQEEPVQRRERPRRVVAQCGGWCDEECYREHSVSHFVRTDGSF